MTRREFPCYQCLRLTNYLFPDARCADCTTMTPEEVSGLAARIQESVRLAARQEKWDRRYINLARTVADWSKDPSTRVGAVLVRPNNSVAATGFNGFPPGHDDSPALYRDRAYKYAHILHAEENALRFLNPDGAPGSEGTARGFTLYTSYPVCCDCMERVATAGVVRVVYPATSMAGRNAPGMQDWEERARAAQEVAARHRITVEVLDV